MKMQMIDYALDYAHRGWAVFPLKERDKSPLTAHGFLDATTNETQIRSWWAKHPNANIGIATGDMSGGLVVIDIDVDEAKNKHGDEVFTQWQEDNGCFIDSLNAVTGSGGKHYYFTSSESFDSAAGYIEDIDIRANGGYVVAPGSIHPNGREYFFDDEDQEIVCVQEDSDVEYFLHEYYRLGGKNNKDKKKFEMSEKITKNRNNFLRDLQGKLAGENLYTPEEIKAQIRTINQTRCDPPLSDEELEKTIFKSTEKWVEKAKTEQPQKPKQTLDVNSLEFPELTKASDLEDEDIPDLAVYVGVDEEVPFIVEGTCILSAKSKLGTTSNTITLTNDTTAITGYVANQGIYYIATGDATLASLGIVTGDWLVATSSGWKKIDNTDVVGSVNGKTGAVTLTASDVGAEPSFSKNTAFNKNFETSTSNIKMNGSVSVGSASTIARADHVHPSDTTKADKSATVSNVAYDTTNKKLT